MNRFRLHYFDLRRGLPTAIRTIGKKLGPRKGAIALFQFVKRSLGPDPLAHIPPSPEFSKQAETLSRLQFRNAYHLDNVARNDLRLSEEDSLDFVEEIIAHTGAAFIAFNLKFITHREWTTMASTGRRTYMQEIVSRFFNSRIVDLVAHTNELSFTVSACRFAQLAHQLGRPHLAAMFCKADSVFFEREESPLRLIRTDTIANGANSCDFRFRFRHTP